MERIKFNYKEINNLKATCGVYIFLLERNDTLSQKRYLYAGASKNVKIRLQQHLYTRTAGNMFSFFLSFYHLWFTDYTLIIEIIPCDYLELKTKEIELFKQYEPLFNFTDKLYTYYR